MSDIEYDGGKAEGPQSQVSKALCELEAAMAANHAMLERLQRKLDPVLGPRLPEPGDPAEKSAEKSAVEVRAPLVIRISEVRKQAEKVLSVGNDLLDRLVV